MINGKPGMIWCRLYSNGQTSEELLGPYSIIDFE
jgi:hypothetical protein